MRGLNFSITAEDVHTVAAALNLAPQMRVVCISSAGDTPLGLLALDSVQVEAVDLSFAQVSLGHLKAAALEKLSHDDALALFGAVPGKHDSVALYDSIRETLPDEVRAFWDSNRRAISRGVLWQGRVQRMLRYATTTLAALGGKELLRSVRSIRTQHDVDAFLRKVDESLAARLALCLVFGRLGFAALYPALGRRNLPPGMSSTQFAYSRLRAAVQRLVPEGNPYLEPLVHGHYRPNAFPPYLNVANHRVLKERIRSQLRFHVGDISAFIASLASDSVGGFALCNVVDWLDQAQWSRLLRSVAAAGMPGARLVVFSRAARRPLPVDAKPLFEENHAAEVAALVSDRTGYHESVYVLTVARQRIS